MVVKSFKCLNHTKRFVIIMSKNIKIKKKSNKIGINRLSSISNLEADIMNIVWSKEKITVREVHEIILLKEIKKKQHGFIPYTTVMSTMAILTDKGLLKQDKSAKTYIYSSAMDKKELSKNIIMSVVEKLLNSDSVSKIDRFLSNRNNISKESMADILKIIDNS